MWALKIVQGKKNKKYKITYLQIYITYPAAVVKKIIFIPGIAERVDNFSSHGIY